MPHKLLTSSFDYDVQSSSKSLLTYKTSGNGRDTSKGKRALIFHKEERL